MGITLVATFTLLVFEDMSHEFPELLNNGISAILSHYFCLFPHFFCTVLPISVFISALISLCHLRNNNEFVAMQGAGLTPWQITKNMWFLGIILSALMILLQSHLGERSHGVNHYDVSYQDGQSGRLWLIGHLNVESGRGENIFVWDPGPPVRWFHAKNAHWDGRYWHLEEVAESSMDELDAECGRRLWVEESLLKFPEAPGQIASQQKRPRDMCLRELRRALRWAPGSSSRTTAYRVRFYALYVACLGPLVALFCAIPFSLKGVRQNPTIGAAKAIGLLFLFHVLTGLSHSLGNSEVLHPLASAGLPFLLPIFVGILCLRH
jgi:lipopolysaccharide export LptBFGC system permease protein LptF